MPTVTVVRDRLFEVLGRHFTDEEFDAVCFEFGIELDEVCKEDTSLGGRARTGTGVEAGTELGEAVEWVYKIEVGANRYDLLCLEGLAQALRIFMGIDRHVPDYRLAPDEGIVMSVEADTAQIRPFVVCALLRDVNLTPQIYQSLIDLQDKLHQNICRRRTLVAIGTHDWDTIVGPFRYQARPPQSIRFVPLAQTQEFDGPGLMAHYDQDLQLKKYLPIIRDSPVYPVIYDSRDTVLSLPPIINGDHSKITLDTKNIFIECTATDLTKAKIVLNTLVAMYSRYCAEPYSVVPVEVRYANGESMQTPDLSSSKMEVDVGYVSRLVGVELAGIEIVNLLGKMQLESTRIDDTRIVVNVPITRSDVIHPCDIAEDVAVAFGFNNVQEQVPAASTVSRGQPINELTDMVRRSGFAEKGYTEVLTWVTVSSNENFEWMQRVDDGFTAVKISNPKTMEFQECRTSLLPGILKTLRENRSMKLPLRLFEVGDVVLKDPSREVGARNRRKMAAVFASTHAGFEIIKALLDHLVTVLGRKGEVTLDPHACQDDAFFPGRRANVVLGSKTVGVIGWIHPKVLKNFSVGSMPSSALELDLEEFI
uniref:phenylalanine--tRNA ligase n=1 Tax=Compsopogon caeruleus TaxID=31354 RepID=A0A7S1T4V3_9RHOD|mmetsp:Transcript_10064/g.20356  ORF Transcript_10064/g.20356 Transcript_10064/m.20356 type:complete len:593 (+) Transcript_10064:148-1926(+)|eukprot:CAMPEP_0184689164 /NCGR_PEP_ID=MMETSP0312-20130426/30502_1 /TAXON_ID=31354 /ORGANISM="Compsopogon coeruleus, Strain SAG 36.94" /LENGTH=592 /DNA_ID=CAMNT_0027146481 /DNA_START=4971 /DNA_END=6749 /DNA_ORIENTATION=+